MRHKYFEVWQRSKKNFLNSRTLFVLMTFKPKNFDNMLEQDVREDIITPLLHRLGYEKDSENDIRRGQYLILRYPKESFGTRKLTDRL